MHDKIRASAKQISVDQTSPENCDHDVIHTHTIEKNKITTILYLKIIKLDSSTFLYYQLSMFTLASINPYSMQMDFR